MADDRGSIQRSFRLSVRTLELLDSEAEAAGQSRNALADRLLGEALRVERHPLIRFHHGAAGRRQPLVTGTRLYVHQVIGTLRASDGDVDQAAGYLGLTVRQVRAAVDYYADFRDEIHADADAAQRVESSERDRWERQQRDSGVKVALDHHYATRIAVRLRRRSCDVIAAIERGWEQEDDEPLLDLCAGESRALLTNNVADFAVIARRWALQGRHHAGLIFTSDASMPRSRQTIGHYVTALQALMRNNPGEDAFQDHVHWL